MSDQLTPLRDIVGKTAAVLDKQLGLVTVGDLLHLYPRRYVERGQLTDLARLVVGDDVTVLATVHSVRQFRMRERKGQVSEVTVTDGRNRLHLTFFNQVWRVKDLTPGRVGLFAGRVTEFNQVRKLNSPDYVLFSEDGGSGWSEADDRVEEFAGSLIPVYPGTAKLPSWVVARSVRLALDWLAPVPEPLPVEVLAEHGLCDLDTALRSIHRPGDRAELAAARRRLAWDEALSVQLTLAQRRHAASVNPARPRPRRPAGLADAFDQRLPFTLTDGQNTVGAEIEADLARAHPMHRLLQGEVGSGKTIVALRAMLQVIDGGGQAALLAPTEVLAAQHARSIEAMLGPLADAGRFGASEHATRVVLLTGSLSLAARRDALAQAASGAAGIVVGTHALIQKTVQFAELGLVVVDEQHRFGVEQRDALRAKSAAPPHLLVMTATPIPRTVAMTVFGDLDTSVLAELPAGRSPISTTVVPVGERPAWLDRAWARVREEVAAGRQAYVVCPSIGGDSTGTAEPDVVDDLDGAPVPDPAPNLGASEASDHAPSDAPRPMRAVLETAEELRNGPLADVRVEVLHGRLPGDEKDRVMLAFATGEIDVLVATTVIEVGVDVANATVMVVLDAERYGVSQLHQLRGRVGRGKEPGLCLLVTGAPPDGPARERLTAIAASTDGFELAYLDLEQRREGDILGASQSGRRSHLKLLSLLRDEDLIVAARATAAELVAGDPDLTRQPLLAEHVAQLIGADRSHYLDKA